MTVVDQTENQNILVNQEEALTVYLQSLLGGGKGGKGGKTVPSPVKSPSLEQSPSLKNTESSASKLSLNLLKESSSQQSVKQVEEIKAPVVVNAVPEWVTSEIKCLSATVAGLNILIPADSVFRILNATNRLKPSTRMPTWIYDLDEEDGEDDVIQVVNTQKLIFDGVKSRRIKPNARTYVVLVDDGSWGLSCDAIGKVVTLKNEDVIWRGENTKRRWLAGTSSHREAVILDVLKIEKALIQ